LSFGPANGATGINASTPIFVRFSQEMVASSVDSGAVLYENGSPAARAIQFEDDGRTLLVTPSAALPYGAPVTLFLAAGLRDQQGQLMAAPHTVSFTVEPAPVLAVTSLSPPSGPAGATITVNGKGFSDIPGVNT